MNAFLKKKNLRLPLPNDKKSSIFAWKKIVLGIIVLILIIVVLNIFQSPIKNTFYVITSPISKVFWNVGNNSSGLLASFFNSQGIIKENNNLKQENQNLLSQISTLQETIKQNQAIQSIVQNTQHDNFKMVLAQAIQLDAASDFILINKGSDDGILQNMPVILDTKVLLGKVFNVYKNFSQVMLISNKNSVVDVKIQNEDISKPTIFGVIKGSQNLSLYLDLVSSDAKINPNDVLITSGQEGVFPKDLLIGKITKTDSNDLKPFQTAQILPFFDIKNTDNVFIITNYK